MCNTKQSQTVQSERLLRLESYCTTTRGSVSDSQQADSTRRGGHPGITFYSLLCLNVKTHSKLLTFGSSTALLQGRRRPRPQKKTSMNDEQRYLAQVARATTTIITTTTSPPVLNLNPWPLEAVAVLAAAAVPANGPPSLSPEWIEKRTN